MDDSVSGLLFGKNPRNKEDKILLSVIVANSY